MKENPDELPWSNHPNLFSDDPTIQLENAGENNRTENGRTCIKPTMSEKEAFQHLLKKRKQEEAESMKAAQKKKKTKDDEIHIQAGAERALTVVNNVEPVTIATRGQGQGRGRGRGRARGK